MLLSALTSKPFGFLFGGIFLVVGLGFVVTTGLSLLNDRSFARDARSTPGIVLKKNITESGRSQRQGSTRSRTKHYEVIYRFTVDGRVLEGRDELSEQEWDRLTEGKPADVLYLPLSTASNTLAGSRPWGATLIFGLLGLMLAALGAFVFSGTIRQARLASRLRQHGVSVKGTVTELVERKLKINGVRQWGLRYEYADFQGHRHEGAIDLPAHEAQAWSVGDTGSVSYDPERPVEAIWLGRPDP
jgi:hypothetical protein